MVIVDKNGYKVATDTVRNQSFDAAETKTVGVIIDVSDVKFWSPDYPNLYTVYTQILIGNETVDVNTVPLGVKKGDFNVAEG